MRTLTDHAIPEFLLASESGLELTEVQGMRAEWHFPTGKHWRECRTKILYLHGGAFPTPPAGRPYRVLVAGGGTGDATVKYATYLANAGIPAELVHMDLSSSSIATYNAEVEGCCGSAVDVATKRRAVKFSRVCGNHSLRR